MTLQALVLDFGGPVIVTPFEVVQRLERRLGVPPGTFKWTGPFDPAADPLWRKMMADEITEVEYWEARAEEVAAVTGCPGFHAVMAELYPADEINSFIRPEASETVRLAKAAGLKKAVLTNDLARYYSDETIGQICLLKDIDAVIDRSAAGALKPDPAAYRTVLNVLQIPAAAALFVDDQPRNVDGARAVGMPAVFFDVTRPSESYRQVVRSLGLSAVDATREG
ncbi:HAD-IA family hydrolase [[Mycobacterium] crassicus]|uniref:HAD-IA family hydrolase n=1 Tax=[Mycobacterium] crassicus TaxID=2872309 RepID=A0ABU5XIU1_9MYCO|nr:HAD-IA family hydrolase [Mycolicibacter sp. MYC098]MEB3022108.1 HAD-IA family hydrolase [Mycolicibacter sp. MYC098]